MITLEQLDELEGRIVRALELIGDLRSENSRLESENERLRGEHDELKLALDEKEKTVQSLREQLDRTGRELNDLKQKEAVLEKRITEMLTRLSDVEAARGSRAAPSAPSSRPAPASYSAPAPSTPASSFAPSAPVSSLSGSGVSSPATAPVLPDDLILAGETMPSGSSGSDESIVLLEDEDLPLQPARSGADVQSAAAEAGQGAPPAQPFTRQAEHEQAPSGGHGEDDDIIILDDEDDDVVFADEEEIEIIEQSPAAVPVAPLAGGAAPPAPAAGAAPAPGASVSLDDDILLDDDDDIGIFDMDDDDDFLIVEEDTHKK